MTLLQSGASDDVLYLQNVGSDHGDDAFAVSC